MTPDKPLGRKAYGHIGHLPGSRMGPGDHQVNPGHARICFEGHSRRPFDRITVTEKLDGSCCAVAKIGGKILPLTRAGYHALTSPYAQHDEFAKWVRFFSPMFSRVISDGQRLVGEWMFQAHGTRYNLPCRSSPWIVFDLMEGARRLPLEDLVRVAQEANLTMPAQMPLTGPTPLDKALEWLGDYGYHGALDPAEGVVYRVETRKRPEDPYTVDFLAKWVRPGKVDGCYLPEVSGGAAIWNVEWV